MGEWLALPPFLEPRRAQIEAGWRPLKYEPFCDIHETLAVLARKPEACFAL